MNNENNSLSEDDDSNEIVQLDFDSNPEVDDNIHVREIFFNNKNDRIKENSNVIPNVNNHETKNEEIEEISTIRKVEEFKLDINTIADEEEIKDEEILVSYEEEVAEEEVADENEPVDEKIPSQNVPLQVDQIIPNMLNQVNTNLLIKTESHLPEAEEMLNTAEEASEFNVELKNNNEFINMSHFDEASNAGFTINYKVSNKQITTSGPMNISPRNIKMEKSKFEERDLSPINKLRQREVFQIEEEIDIYNPVPVNKVSSNGVNKPMPDIKEIVNKFDILNFSDTELLSTFSSVKNSNFFDKFISQLQCKGGMGYEKIKRIEKNEKNENMKKNEKTEKIVKTEKIEKLSKKKLDNNLITKSNKISVADKNPKLFNNNLFLSQVRNTNTNTNIPPQDNQHINKLKETIMIKDETIKSLEEELKLLKLALNKTKQSLSELHLQNEEEINTFHEKFENALTENTILSNKLTEANIINKQLKREIFEKSESIDHFNSELIQKEEIFHKNSDEVSLLRNQLDNMKMELNIQRNDLNKKNDKISELQQYNISVEQELNDYKSRTVNEITNLKESKKSFDSLKSNYYEIKNQYELINMKYQSISDENFNIKRDLLLYEKEMKNKNETIERLRREVIESSKTNYLSEISSPSSSSNLNLNLNLNNILKGSSGPAQHYEIKSDRDHVYNSNSNLSTENPGGNTKNFKKRNVIKNELYEKHLEEFNKTVTVNNNREDLDTNSSANNKVSTGKENRIKVIENNFFEMNKERDFVFSELNKLPQYPKKREQICKRKELEEKIENISRDLAKMKQELKELNAFKRDN